MHLSRSTVFFLIGFLAMSFVADAAAQTKRKPTVKKPGVASLEIKKEELKPQPTAVEPISKRNERPNASGAQTAPPVTVPPFTPDLYYIYEFTQPEFITNRVLIEHDGKGVGRFSFTRRGNSELVTDPLQISPAAMERLNDAYTALNFHNSTENYQDTRDYSHLGIVKIAMTQGGRERSVTFNFTQNKNAKLLADEYRRIGNQALWIFDIKLARDNQPLVSPSQMNLLDSLLKRNEISDPAQLLPFLSELSDDERLPLLTRNHATRIAQQIEKKVAKSK